MPELAETPLALLGELSNGSAVEPAQVIDALINALSACLQEPALLVLDDYHIVSGSPEVGGLVERFLTFLPADLHAILSMRHPVDLPALATWRARGEVLEIGRAELAFRIEETADLFCQTYGMNLAPEEVALLYDKTEGWPIALQLAWQGLRSGAAEDVLDLLARPGSAASGQRGGPPQRYSNTWRTNCWIASRRRSACSSAKRLSLGN